MVLEISALKGNNIDKIIDYIIISIYEKETYIEKTLDNDKNLRRIILNKEDFTKSKKKVLLKLKL